MGIFGKLFGSDKAIGAIVESASKSLDALVYTDEEKAKDAAKDRSEARAMIIDWMAASQGSRLSRRVLAISITGVWLLMFLVATFTPMIGVYADPERMQSISQIAKDGYTEMSSAVMLILSFYFAAPYAGEIMKNFGKK